MQRLSQEDSVRQGGNVPIQSLNLNGDRLTVYAKDDRGEFTRRFERSAGDAALFNAVDGLGGSVRYTSRYTLTVDQPDLGATCSFRRSD